MAQTLSSPDIPAVVPTSVSGCILNQAEKARNALRVLDLGHKKRRPLTSIDVPMVPKAGLEPARISTVDFESTASTDFATPARKGMRKRVGLYLSIASMQAAPRVRSAKC